MSTLTNRCYSLLRTVPIGKVTTYKALAHKLGIKSYRAIGQIMRRNPDSPHTPCHRVVSSNGTIGGFMGQTSGDKIKTKIHLLSSEGVTVSNHKIINFSTHLWDFSHPPGHTSA